MFDLSTNKAMKSSPELNREADEAGNSINLLQVSALLSNSAAACLELQQFEEALLYSSTAAMMQIADEGLLSKADGLDVLGVLRWRFP